MRKMTKKEFERIYKGSIVEKSDIDCYFVVYGAAHIPVQFSTFKKFFKLSEADINAKFKMNGQSRPIVQVIEG